MKTHKGTRIVILSLVVILLTSAFSLAITNLCLLKNQNEENKVDIVDAFDVTSYFGTIEYNAYSTFIIDSIEGFNLLFPDSGYGELTGKKYYAGKTVKLNDHLIAESANELWIPMFAGTFDGQGHTISISKESNVWESVTVEGYHTTAREYGNAGLFCGELRSLTIGSNTYKGTIKNTRFSNCVAYCDSGNSTKTEAGIVVGYNNGGVVDSCIVENLTFESNRDVSRCSVAPLVGKNSGVVQNCIVKGIYKIGGVADDLLADGLNAYYFVVSGNEAKQSIYTATISTFGETGDLKTPDSADTNAFDSTFSNYKNYTNAYTNFPDSIAITDDPTEEDPCTTPWYKYKEYSSGTYRGYGCDANIPIYLRAFITFKTINFVPASTTYGTVDEDEITVPSDYTSSSISDNRITIYEQVITATPEDNYNFYNWTSSTSGDGVTTWTANFSVRTCSIQFQIPSNVTLKVNNVVQTETQSFTIKRGNTIEYSASTYSGMGGKYSSVTYTFTDSGNRKKTVTYTIAGTDNYISGASLNSGTEVYDDLTITVTLAERDYGLEFI